MVVNPPGGIREVATGLREGNEAAEELEKGAQIASKAEQRLSNYIQKRSVDGAKPPLQATEQRYQRAINAAKRAETDLKSKLDDTLKTLRTSKIGAAIEAINAPGATFGAELDVITHAKQAAHGLRWAWGEIEAGWHDLGTEFTHRCPSTPSCPMRMRWRFSISGRKRFSGRAAPTHGRICSHIYPFIWP